MHSIIKGNLCGLIDHKIQSKTDFLYNWILFSFLIGFKDLINPQKFLLIIECILNWIKYVFQWYFGLVFPYLLKSLMELRMEIRFEALWRYCLTQMVDRFSLLIRYIWAYLQILKDRILRNDSMRSLLFC